MLFVLGPMLATFAIQRTVLHHSSPDTHVYVAGYLVHHLFWGILILIPTAFLLALGIQTAWLRNLARGVLGFSSAMVLDEVIYLICTDGSGVAYRNSVSFTGALILLTLATLFLGVAGLPGRRIGPPPSERSRSHPGEKSSRK
jgi:hypothetical protein